MKRTILQGLAVLLAILLLTGMAVPTITSAVVKEVNLGSTLSFSRSDFCSCSCLNNGTLVNIVITAAKSKYGSWYKGTNTFTGAQTFDANDLGTLKFKGKLCGQATFTWTVSNEKGASATGCGKITVKPNTGMTDYTTATNTPRAFAASDFNAACMSATGAYLRSISFVLPSSSCGTLYADDASPSNPGTAINADSVLYYRKTPKLSTVTFVPATNYTGTVMITYIGVNTNDIAYAGTVKIIVGNAGDVTYITAPHHVKTFSTSDFNNACINVTGTNLSCIYFIAPTSSHGTLYDGYSSPTSPGTAVSPNSPYALQNLSAIMFVPAANFADTLSIPYTGVAINRAIYTGYIKLTVVPSDRDKCTSLEIP